ncbi:MAG: hypothetical protein A2275_01640 [Bacteroidetes bacterium RIFOXYA12_FULL_35_11]|nr:MAG: hypothetical protein A2X01_04870 [Bacteroidetes bacterium GWF2_35_48]OFY72918.1 MAG: hypothetical protein A2275_01640 [Bacteroidetes bacterium RIFOXYA12_FULL_35_11]OFY99741.1 MAG: hypothetical protein A2491_09515 [Bacteroidetes bacterium RIFOXYC12_FULL_35_7]HBX51959.1 hypothetical protein [Bacteroidales bacterium]
MSTNNFSFSDDLGKLIVYFRQIRDTLQQKQDSSIDKAFLQNIDMMIANYENIKSTVPPEMLNAMGAPIQKLMHVLMDQLKTEYGDMYLPTETKEEHIIKEVETSTTNTPDFKAEIKKIDDWLLTPNLDSSEIDRLLDKRAELSAKLNNQVVSNSVNE